MTVIKPADPFPAISFKLLNAEPVKLSDYSGKWVMLVAYRGHHCPRCKTYIARLHEMVASYAERNVTLLLASTDPEAVAKRTVEENNWTLPTAHSMSLDEARQLGLYITDHEADYELDGQYSEPGLFLINPEGLTQVIETSNSPSVRPDLTVVLDGIIGTQDRGLPIRGLAG